MRRMTFFRLTVYSDTTIIGSVAISTREILEFQKKEKILFFVEILSTRVRSRENSA